jgi:hypothetical protein
MGKPAITNQGTQLMHEGKRACVEGSVIPTECGSNSRMWLDRRDGRSEGCNLDRLNMGCRSERSCITPSPWLHTHESDTAASSENPACSSRWGGVRAQACMRATVSPRENKTGSTSARADRTSIPSSDLFPSGYPPFPVGFPGSDSAYLYNSLHTCRHW